jgi:hypothetical protein
MHLLDYMGIFEPAVNGVAPARRSLGEVGRDGLIIGRRFSFSAGY